MNLIIQKRLTAMPRFATTKTRGYVALVSVLIVGAIGLTAVTGVILLGLSWSRTSLTLQQSFQAKTLADACIEEALQQIKDSIPFSGNGTLTLGQGSCAYTVTNNGAQNRSLVSVGMVGTVIRRVAVTLDKISPSINITSWQEVP
ncbi:MAG: hypothetical protein WAV56_00010 [Microgenomates group bacterium]